MLMVSGGYPAAASCHHVTRIVQGHPVQPGALTAGTGKPKEGETGQGYHAGQGGILPGSCAPSYGRQHEELPPKLREQVAILVPW